MQLNELRRMFALIELTHLRAPIERFMAVEIEDMIMEYGQGAGEKPKFIIYTSALEPFLRNLIKEVEPEVRTLSGIRSIKHINSDELILRLTNYDPREIAKHSTQFKPLPSEAAFSFSESE